ncbi:MAG TPA: hypothetical protein VNB22_16270 [Pyrinomonadaceae bacterium]|nr:hypothetical protein [Pyrinomonadaceae bacterium]
MTTKEIIELIAGIVTPLLALATVLIGIWQFNKGQRELKDREINQRNFELEKMNNQANLETLSKFKELQSKLYNETTSIIGYLAVSDDFKSAEYKAKLERFWQLYWVELSTVETEDVEDAMVEFGDILEELQDTKFKDFEDKQDDLKNAAYDVAQAIKESVRTWELPEGLKGEVVNQSETPAKPIVKSLKPKPPNFDDAKTVKTRTAKPAPVRKK